MCLIPFWNSWTALLRPDHHRIISDYPVVEQSVSCFIFMGLIYLKWQIIFLSPLTLLNLQGSQSKFGLAEAFPPETYAQVDSFKDWSKFKQEARIWAIEKQGEYTKSKLIRNKQYNQYLADQLQSDIFAFEYLSFCFIDQVCRDRWLDNEERCRTQTKIQWSPVSPLGRGCGKSYRSSLIRDQSDHFFDLY